MKYYTPLGWPRSSYKTSERHTKGEGATEEKESQIWWHGQLTAAVEVAAVLATDLSKSERPYVWRPLVFDYTLVGHVVIHGLVHGIQMGGCITIRSNLLYE